MAKQRTLGLSHTLRLLVDDICVLIEVFRANYERIAMCSMHLSRNAREKFSGTDNVEEGVVGVPSGEAGSGCFGST